jgi:cell division protein FtsQ
VLGLTRVDDTDVTARIKLRTDRNTNIFAVDMEDVRARVEQIQWVRYATVERILPDQILIRVVERESIGLARIQGHIYEFDADAAILDPNPSSTSHFPILNGLQENDTEGNLLKIAKYRQVIGDLGDIKSSEIIVNQSNEVSIVRGEDALIVNLGTEDFKQRWSQYLAVKDKIESEYKDAVVVDLRFRNQVIVSNEDDGDGGKVVWDGKKKSL